MGAEIDRLEVQIETEAAKANHELDLLVKKLSLLAEGISAIKSNKGLDEFASKAQSVAKSMESLRSGTKAISKSIGEPAKKVAKSFDEIASKYKDLGKEFEFFGNVQSIQRKIETLSNALEDAKIRAQELEAAGKTDGTMYDSAVRDVVKYQNQIESLKKQLEEIGKIKENHEIKIQYITDSEQTLDDFKRQLESFDKIVESGGKQSESGETMFPVRGLEMTLENLREMYPEAKELMSSYEAEIERAKSLTIGGMAQYGKINLESFAPTGETTNKVKEFGEALSSLEVPEIREENLDKLRNSLEKAEEKLDKLRANLANGLTMGRIVDNTDSKIYRNIQEQIALTEKAIDALKNKIEEVEKTSGGLKELEEKLSQLSVPEIRENNLDKLRNSLGKTEEKLDRLRAALSNGITMGRITENPDDATYRNIQEQITLTEKRVGALRSKIQEVRQTSGGLKEFEERLSQLKVPQIREDNLRKLRESLEKTEAQLDKLRTKLANGIAMGRITESPDDKGYRNIQEQIALTEKTVDALREKISNTEKEAGRAGGFSTLKKSMLDVDKSAKYISQSFSKVISVIKKFGVTIKSVISKLGKMIKSMLMLGNTSKKSNASFGNGLKTILKYGFGIRSLYVLVNKLKAAIKDGMENLVQYSEKTNQSVSTLSSSLNQFKNASAAAVAPILNAIAPALNAIIQLFIRAANAVNQFFSALTGNGTWIKAKYVYNDVADGISKASKAAKGALQPFDALNNLTTQDSSGSGINPGDMFETVPVDSKFQNVADKIKDILKKLFNPLKEAWDRVGNKVIKAWKYALDEIRKLIKDIGRDFLEVWNQEATIRMLEDVLRIIQHIGTTIGNLARQFRLAWNENDVGLHILENIRDIIAIIIHNIQVAAAYTALWAGNLDFYPLLDKLNQWLESVEPVVEAISGVLLDFYTQVLLPLSKWVLEKGLPDLLQVFIDFNNKVDWESIRANLAEFWKHLEPFAETVGAGLIEFIDRCAQALANFLNSQEFKDFLIEVEEWMDNVSPSDVADALEMVAKGLIALKLALLGYSAIQAITGVLATVKAFLSFFGVGGGAAETASTMETVATSSGTLATALGDLFTVLGGAAAFDLGIKNKLFDLIEILTGDTETVDKLRERYGELGGTVDIVKDMFSVAGNTLQGYGAVISDSISLNDALEKAMNNIANGAIYTDEQLFTLKEKFGATNEDIEMLRQSTLDANPILTEMADTFGLYDATPQTLQNIAAGLGEIASTGDLSIETLNGMTQEAQNFFNQQTIDGFDYFIGKLNEVDASADNLNQGMDLVSTSIEENSERIKEAANNIGGGLNSGIESAEPESAVSSFFDKVKNALCNIFGIHSPATKMVPFGEYITLGVLEGFANKFSAFTAPITQLCNIITTGLSNGMQRARSVWASMWNQIASIVTNITSSISSKISAFVSNVSNAFSRITGSMKNIGNSLPSIGVSSKTTKMKGFANGGFPEPYSIIGVGEGGKAEMFGTVGGKTAIAGNGEITGIADAVYNTGQTEASLLQMAVSLLQTIADKPTISKDDVFGMTQSAYNEKANRCGYTKDPVFV